MSNNDLPYTNADNIYFIVDLIDEYIDLVEELEEAKRKAVTNEQRGYYQVHKR